MREREILARCLKARIVSWLQNCRLGVVIPTIDGSGCVIAVYHNGRYVEPELVQVPDSPADLGWGPDGPATYNQEKPPEPDEGSS